MLKSPAASFMRIAVCIAAAGLLAACDGDAIAPEGARPQFNDVLAFPQIVTVCKVGPSGTSASFTLSRSAPVGMLPHGESFTLMASDTPNISLCKTVWTASSPTDPSVDITITEVLQTGMTLEQTTVFSCAGTQDSTPGVNPIVVNVNYACGAFVLFKNTVVETPPPPPPGGGEGCTPGYWKQKHHFDSWPSAYSPNMQFSAVFANAFPGKTLLQVLSQGGGGLIALGRHTVAALLSSGSVSYGLTTTEVIAAFNLAYSTGKYEATHKLFEGLNEAGCPLN